MEIYRTKKQPENIPRSCSYLLLKHYFISYWSVLHYPILKVACELDNCKITFIYPRNRPFEVCKYKALRYTGLFSLHIERPSYSLHFSC